jgi:hypothetical protein
LRRPHSWCVHLQCDVVAESGRALKEWRHEAEEGEEIEEVSPVWLMRQTAGHRFGRLPFPQVDTLASRGHLPVIICRTLQAKPRVVAQRLKEVFSPPDHSPERKVRTAAANRPLDTAALLGVIVLIGLVIFLLWDRHHSLRQARHSLELQHQSQGDYRPVDIAAAGGPI